MSACPPRLSFDSRPNDFDGGGGVTVCSGSCCCCCCCCVHWAGAVIGGVAGALGGHFKTHRRASGLVPEGTGMFIFLGALVGCAATAALATADGLLGSKLMGQPYFLMALVFAPNILFVFTGLGSMAMIYPRYRRARGSSAIETWHGGSVYCPQCGYDLRASVPFGRCPECGRGIDEKCYTRQDGGWRCAWRSALWGMVWSTVGTIVGWGPTYLIFRNM